MKHTTNEIFSILGIKKIVKTKDVFCRCNSRNLQKLYTDIDEKNCIAYDNRQNKIVEIDKYTDIDIDYCKDCGRVDYIMADQGYIDSYRMYYKEGVTVECLCGKGKIDNNEGYVIIMGVTEEGDMIIRSNHCNTDVLVGTSLIFGNRHNFLEWINKISEIEVNKNEIEFMDQRLNIFRNVLSFAKGNNISIHTLEDLYK